MLPGRVNADVRRTRPAGTDGVDERELPARAIDGIRADRAGLATIEIRHFVRGIKVGPAGMQRERRRIQGRDENVSLAKRAGRGIGVEDVDAPSAV
jgi:hypothetical protein